MAGSVLENPGRLGIISLLLLVAAAIIAVLIGFSCDSEQSSANDETIVSESAVPDVSTVADGGTSSDSNPVSSGDEVAGQVTDPGVASPANTFSSQPSSGNGSPAPTGPNPGAIAGTVLGEGSGPIDGVSVFLFLSDGSPAGVVTASVTDGSFRFDLAPGQYKLYFADPLGAFEPAWYGGYGPGSAALVTVTSSQQVDITQTLAWNSDAGAIEGMVRDDKGMGVAGVKVSAFLYENIKCLAGSCDSMSWKSTVSTDQTGAYRIIGLEPGSYKLQFNPIGAKLTLQWYHEQTTHETAKTVAVTSGTVTTGIDANLYAGGTLSGVITREGGQPDSFARVDVYDDSGVIVNHSLLTDAGGRYQSTSLPNGSYRVSASTNISGVWTTEWYSDKSDFSSANPVQITSGSDRGGVNIEINRRTNGGESPGGIIIELPSAGGVVAGQQQPCAQPAVMNTDAVVAPLELEDDGASDSDGLLNQRPDAALLPDEDQQDVVGDGGDDEAIVDQVE